MNPYKVIIIDDEDPARLLVKHFLENRDDCSIVAECSNGFEAIKAINEFHPDLIVLDIQMPKINGFELLEVIDKPYPQVIFATAYDEFAIKAFENNACDYLLKPFSADRLNAAIDKAIARVPGKQEQTPELRISQSIPPSADHIIVKKKNNLIVIPFEDIIFMESSDDYVEIHTPSDTFLKEKTMSYYEQNLPHGLFVRIHRKYIVNLKKIQRVELYDKQNWVVVMEGGSELRASREGYKQLRQAIG